MVDSTDLFLFLRASSDGRDIRSFSGERVAMNLQIVFSACLFAIRFVFQVSHSSLCPASLDRVRVSSLQIVPLFCFMQLVCALPAKIVFEEAQLASK
jgi:hypothetical protein